MAIEIPDTRAIGLSAANFRQYVAEIAKAVEDSSRAQRASNLEALASFTNLTTGVGKLANGMAQLAVAGREDSAGIAALLTQFSGLESAVEGAGLVALGGAQRLQQLSAASAAATTASGRLMAAAGNLGPALAALSIGYAIGSTIHRLLHRDEERHAELMLKSAQAANAKQRALVAMAAAVPHSILKTEALGDEADKLRIERDGLPLGAQMALRANRITETAGALHQFRVQEKVGRDFGDADLIKSGVQGQIDALNRMLDLQRGQRNAVRDTVQERMRELDAQNQLIRQSQEALKQERGRLQSMEAAFSRLNPVERDELAWIARKKSRGEQLTEVELARLERSNIAPLQNFAEEQRAAQGRAFGSNFVISPFEGRPLRGTGSEEQRLETEIAEQTRNRNALDASIRELTQADRRLMEGLIRAVNDTRRETIRLSTLLADTNTARSSAF